MDEEEVEGVGGAACQWVIFCLTIPFYSVQCSCIKIEYGFFGKQQKGQEVFSSGRGVAFLFSN